MERMHEIMRERLDADQALYNSRQEHYDTINRLDEEIALTGPIKIGDIVGVIGFPHHGKKMIVDALWVNNDWRGVGIRAEGRLLKKDGTPGLLRADYLIEVAVAP